MLGCWRSRSLRTATGLGVSEVALDVGGHSEWLVPRHFRSQAKERKNSCGKVCPCLASAAATVNESLSTNLTSIT